MRRREHRGSCVVTTELWFPASVRALVVTDMQLFAFGCGSGATLWSPDGERVEYFGGISGCSLKAEELNSASILGLGESFQRGWPLTPCHLYHLWWKRCKSLQHQPQECPLWSCNPLCTERKQGVLRRWGPGSSSDTGHRHRQVGLLHFGGRCTLLEVQNLPRIWDHHHFPTDSVIKWGHLPS